MARISDYIEAPYQGVSQAAAQVRLLTQAEDIQDTALNVPQGAEKRPPFEFICKLADHPGDPTGMFALVNQGGQDHALTITMEAGEAVPRLYKLSDAPTGYSATGLDSLPITIEPAAQDYLNQGSPSPNLDLQNLTVEDYTFILNRKTTVGKQAGTTATRPFEAIAWVRAGAYGRTYSIEVTPSGGSPVTARVHTPNGASPADATYVDTDVLARALYDGFYPYTANEATVTGSLIPALVTLGFTVNLLGPLIYIAHPTVDFTVIVQDGQGGDALTVIKDRAQSFSDLPKKALAGFSVRITQQSASDRDDFFVTYTETAGAGSGVWEETIGPGSELGLDPDTMPVGLVSEAGAWSLKVLQWEGRLVGNETLSPDPDFVGRTLTDICFWKERLGLVSAEGITLSSASDPFKMYPTTLATVIASDAVSLFNPFDQQAQFSFAIPFDQKLILWGKKAQAQVTAEGPFTPDSADIDEFSTYEYATEASPQGSNNRLYFAAPRGVNYSSVYEMDVNQTTATVEGDDLSVSVPRYVPASLDRIASCPVNYLIVYGRSGDTSVIPHLFRYAEKQRVQNSWSTWNLPEGYTFGGGFFLNTSFYVLACKDGGAYLLKADTAPGNLDPDADARIRTHLDLRASQAQVLRAYDPDTDITTLTLPYPAPGNASVVAAAPGGLGGEEESEGVLLPAPEGTLAEVLSSTGTTIELRGDWTTVDFFVGEQYSMRILLSKIYARDPDGNPLRSGRLTLKKLILDLDKTAYLKVRVTAGARAPYEYVFEGGFADDPQSEYDKMLLYSGTWDVPIKANNEAVTIEIINDSPFPSGWLGFTWEGELNLRAGRA